MISQFPNAGNATIPISGQSQCLISYKFAHVMSQRAIGKSVLVINAVNETIKGSPKRFNWPSPLKKGYATLFHHRFSIIFFGILSGDSKDRFHYHAINTAHKTVQWKKPRK